MAYGTPPGGCGKGVTAGKALTEAYLTKSALTLSYVSYLTTALIHGMQFRYLLHIW